MSERRVKAFGEVLNRDNIEVTLTVTMTVKQWHEVAEGVRAHISDYSVFAFINVIRKFAEKLKERFAVEPTEEGDNPNA